MINGSLHRAPPPHCKAVFGRKLYPLKIRPKNSDFSGIRGLNVKFLFSNPEKARACAEPRRLAYFAWKSVQGPGLWDVGRTRKTKKPSKHFWRAISRIRGKETPRGIVTKFCLSVDIHDIITCATFGDDRLRGLGVARGRISRFHIDLRRRPYNTLALPCECVIGGLSVTTFTLLQVIATQYNNTPPLSSHETIIPF